MMTQACMVGRHWRAPHPRHMPPLCAAQPALLARATLPLQVITLKFAGR